MDGHAAVTDAAVVQALFDEAIALHRSVRDSVQEPVIEAAEAIRSALGAGGKLLVFGNSGSAADAQHMAAGLVSRFERERDGMAAIALTAGTSIATSPTISRLIGLLRVRSTHWARPKSASHDSRHDYEY